MFKRYTYLILGEVMLALIFVVFVFSCIRVMKGDIQNGTNLVSLETSKDTPYNNDYFVYFEKHVLINKYLEFCVVGEECDNDKVETASLSSASGGVIGIEDDILFALTAAHFCFDTEEDLLATGEDGKYIEYKKLIIVHFLNTATSAYIEKIDPKSDLCLLSFRINELETRKFDFDNIKLAKKMPDIGENIFTVSSPLSIYGKSFRLHFNGNYGGCDSRYGCMYTIPATYGSSGSLVLNKKGQLISVVSISIIPFQNISAGPHVDEIRKFLLDFDKETGIILY